MFHPRSPRIHFDAVNSNLCLFFYYLRADYWFSNQLFRKEDFDGLSAARVGCPPSS